MNVLTAVSQPQTETGASTSGWSDVPEGGQVFTDVWTEDAQATWGVECPRFSSFLFM